MFSVRGGPYYTALTEHIDNNNDISSSSPPPTPLITDNPGEYRSQTTINDNPGEYRTQTTINDNPGEYRNQATINDNPGEYRNQATISDNPGQYRNQATIYDNPGEPPPATIVTHHLPADRNSSRLSISCRCWNWNKVTANLENLKWTFLSL